MKNDILHSAQNDKGCLVLQSPATTTNLDAFTLYHRVLPEFALCRISLYETSCTRAPKSLVACGPSPPITPIVFILNSFPRSTGSQHKDNSDKSLSAGCHAAPSSVSTLYLIAAKLDRTTQHLASDQNDLLLPYSFLTMYYSNLNSTTNGIDFVVLTVIGT